jgi:hypothetical protein
MTPSGAPPDDGLSTAVSRAMRDQDYAPARLPPSQTSRSRYGSQATASTLTFACPVIERAGRRCRREMDQAGTGRGRRHSSRRPRFPPPPARPTRPATRSARGRRRYSPRSRARRAPGPTRSLPPPRASACVSTPTAIMPTPPRPMKDAARQSCAERCQASMKSRRPPGPASGARQIQRKRLGQPNHESPRRPPHPLAQAGHHRPAQPTQHS